LTVLEELELLAGSKEIRSADRAVIRNLLRKSKRGQQFDYQERQNLWAYLTRYHDHVRELRERAVR
jgi:hypothetical protein